MSSLRLLCRAALRLHDIYTTRATQAIEAMLRERLAPFKHASGKVQALARAAVAEPKAVNCLALERQLQGLLAELRSATAPCCRFVRDARSAVPDQRNLVEELRQLEEEFGDIEIDLKRKLLAVNLAPITLEDVYLGPFAIQLTWSGLVHDVTSHALDIVALNANPPANNDGVTHPHVNGDKLCAGDASAPIKLALEQGRLVDAFCLARSVLTTYNPGSAYVALDLWDGCSCGECGYETGSDDSYPCTQCGDTFCSECITDCGGCRDSHCHDCLQQCPRCQEWFCSDCLSRPEPSQPRCCSRCRQKCAECGEKLTDPKKALCDACLADKALASAGIDVSQPFSEEIPHESVLTATGP